MVSSVLFGCTMLNKLLPVIARRRFALHNSFLKFDFSGIGVFNLGNFLALILVNNELVRAKSTGLIGHQLLCWGSVFTFVDASSFEIELTVAIQILFSLLLQISFIDFLYSNFYLY